MKNLFWCTFFLLGLYLFSCEKDNFDHNDSTTTTAFEPNITALDPGSWEYQLDTLKIHLDSNWFFNREIDSGLTGFSFFDEATMSPQHSLAVTFSGGQENLQLEEGEYPLTGLEYAVGVYSIEEGWQNSMYEWTDDQIEGTLTITTSTEVYDNVYNAYRIELSGFTEATLTNVDGTTSQFTSAFNRVKN